MTNFRDHELGESRQLIAEYPMFKVAKYSGFEPWVIT
jgi:hypothetical protein